MNAVTAGAEVPIAAWHRLDALPGAPVLGSWVLQAKKGKPAVWRLDLGHQAIPAVVAKYAAADAAALERRVYVDWLAAADLQTPTFLGSAPDDDGGVWMFVEFVGGSPYDAADPAHCVLAADWLGRLHRDFTGRVAGSDLPQVGAARYRELLGTTLGDVPSIRSNRALGVDGRASVDHLADLLRTVDQEWADIERACSAWAPTLVHGSFSARNMRVVKSAGGPCLRVFDWGAAGSGPVARDIAKLVGASIGGDAARYLASAAADPGVLRLVAVGRLFRTIEHLRWVVPRLEYSWVEGPLSVVRRHVGQLRDLTAGRAWLADPPNLESGVSRGFEE